MMINFNQLRIFYQTAKYQSCTVAAQKLFITQPAVTAQIKAFEDSCNLRLFKKKGRKIYLADEGKTLFEYAKKNRVDFLVINEKDIEGAHPNLVHSLDSEQFKEEVVIGKSSGPYVIRIYSVNN